MWLCVVGDVRGQIGGERKGRGPVINRPQEKEMGRKDPGGRIGSGGTHPRTEPVLGCV